MGDRALKQLEDDFKAEYAKSNRSCHQHIAKDELRIGKLDIAPDFDGEVYYWYHLDCFETKYGTNVKRATDINGLSNLKWADQQELKRRFEKEDKEDDVVEDDDEDEEENDDEDGVSADYAKSGNSTCKGCFGLIAKQELQIGVSGTDTYSGYNTTSYYHLNCFKIPSDIYSPDSIRGLASLSVNDRRNVQDYVNSALNIQVPKRKDIEEEREERASKKRKTEASEKERSEKLWEIKGKLKDYISNELRAILRYNNQDYKGVGASDMLDRIADGELNGALPRCSKCKTGHLFNDAELSKLVEEVKGDFSRIPQPSSSSKNVSSSLFKGVVASLVGDFPSKDEISDLLMSHGASVQPTVTKKVTHLISTFIKRAVAAYSMLSIQNYLLWDSNSNAPINASEVEVPKKYSSTTSTPNTTNATSSAAMDPELKAYYEATATKPKQRKKLTVPKVDSKSEYSNGSILVENGDVYGIMLNKTDLTHGQTGLNSFYLMQIIDAGGKYSVFRKWGRVGQDGNTTESLYSTRKEATEEFKKIFYEKTRNTFDDFLNDDYEKKPGKFYPVELDVEDDSEVTDERLQRVKDILTKGRECTLDMRIQELVKLLLDPAVFEEKLEELQIDTKKMPVGRLSKAQIAKGTAVLEEIEQELARNAPDPTYLVDASNRFYTIIPHDFGYTKPVVIKSKDILQDKYDLLEILGDIEIAARMLDEEGLPEIHPINKQYSQLKNRLEIVEKNTQEFKIIQKYWDNTGGTMQIEEVFRLHRQGEENLFKKWNHLTNRKLLWHGSSVAVFAAILSGGLKIMPHSGGRVGAGLYFADMIEKSEQYLGFHDNTGLVLLNEVALGDIAFIRNDDCSLTKAPSGHDSVLAQGSVIPDPKDDYLDTSMSESGHPVTIPQGNRVEYVQNTSFYHNEYLIYDQTQVSMRYLIKIRSG